MIFDISNLVFFGYLKKHKPIRKRTYEICLMTFIVKSNNAVKRLRMREVLSELSFELVQRLRKSISLGAFIKL